MWDAASAWPDEPCHIHAQDLNQRNTGPPAAEWANLTTRPWGLPQAAVFFKAPRDSSVQESQLESGHSPWASLPLASKVGLHPSPHRDCLSLRLCWPSPPHWSLTDPLSLGAHGSAHSCFSDCAFSIPSCLEGDALGAMEKLCRQLTYHLSPHSQWRRHRGLVKRKPQACLKAILAGSPPDNTVDLSGIPLTSRDLERVTSYLQRCGEQVDSVELGFTGLTDDMVLQLLPALSTLPRLTTLALNGNRLTRALLRDLTDTLKDPSKFPSVTWIDLGNNVDIFSLPQPFLLSLRKRSPKQGHLPTILELGEGPGCGEEGRDGTEGQEDPGGGSLAPAKDYEDRETVGAAQT
uniref:Leucine rich repeat containing 75A n=1 Tax=Equus caballus TaxID=9796 RepID=F6Y548_HORSE